jgi:hypothetical protein
MVTSGYITTVFRKALPVSSLLASKPFILGWLEMRAFDGMYAITYAENQVPIRLVLKTCAI